MLKKTAIEKIPELAAALMDKGSLLAPVKEASGHNFAEIKDPQKVDLNFYNTIMSPKGAFFPHKEDFIKYNTGKPTFGGRTDRSGSQTGVPVWSASLRCQKFLHYGYSLQCRGNS